MYINSPGGSVSSGTLPFFRPPIHNKLLT
jgi:ATP-dependent protease ClpP protease subunit